MDEIVEAALRKWPGVPHCYGWLGLDARGEWFLRDERAQAAGAFPESKGSRIVNRRLREFIERNYAGDEGGCWFFQNGPQRVYVELEATPWVWRLHAVPDGAPRIVSHTGREAASHAALLDERGRLYLDTDAGLGIVHTLDMEFAAAAVEAGRWVPRDVVSDELPAIGGYVRSPAARRAAAGVAPATSPR